MTKITVALCFAIVAVGLGITIAEQSAPPPGDAPVADIPPSPDRGTIEWPANPFVAREVVLVNAKGEPRLALTMVDDQPVIIFIDPGMTLEQAKLNVSAGNTKDAVQRVHQ